LARQKNAAAHRMVRRVLVEYPSSHFGLYAAAALVGAVVGTAIGLRWLSQTAPRFVLAVILLAAGFQLVFS
jgi:hypothetical protein